jgi:ribonuclease HII
VGGADEAGRGCLAGPLVAAAVCLDLERLDVRRLSGLDDSKRVAPPDRDRLAAAICQTAAAVSVIIVPADQIDRRGLHRSNLHALARALETLEPVPEVALTDGFSLPACGLEHRRVIGGDHTSAAIAAASIIAKTTRDRFMHAEAERYPDYGFEHHVGYITPDHSDAVRRHGVTPLHRRSFQAMAYVGLLD